MTRRVFPTDLELGDRKHSTADARKGIGFR